MAFNRLDFKAVLLGLISSVTGAIFIWSLGNSYLRATSLGLLILWILLVALLVFYLHKLQRDMIRFLSSFRAQDVSQTFPVRRADRFMKRLYEQLNEINATFRLVRIEKEQEHQFFMQTIQHIGTGIMAFNEKGMIRFSNRALEKLLGILSVTNIKHLEKVSIGLPELLEKLLPGEQSLQRIMVNNKTKHISILTTSFRMDDEQITLATFQDISRDIDQTEMDAWQKMMKVVIHEITSSAVPFRLLSSKLSDYLKPEITSEGRIVLEGEALEESQSMVDIIHKRSLGLAKFADSYRAFEQIPLPDMHPVSVPGIFSEVELYFSEILAERSIKLTIHTDPQDMLILADEQLVIQMIINLVNNAIHALDQTTEPSISLIASTTDTQVILEVRDNGHGIPSDLLDSIFIPFYTTREGGSGIGLSLAKQIMNAHQGDIIPISEPGQGTTFKLLFQDVSA
jgi:signal transduction histidine kinase